MESILNSTSPSPRKNNLSINPIVLVFGSVALIIISSLVTYFLVIKNLQTASQQANNIQPQPINSNTSIPTVMDKTVGWNTFKSFNYGYEFKYPSTAVLKEIGDGVIHRTDSCVLLKMQYAYLSIKAPGGPSGGCVQTGLGVYSVVTPVTEMLNIEGRGYAFEGKSLDNTSDPDAAGKNGELMEFLRVDNFNDTEDFIIEYGGSYTKNTESIYLKEKEVLKQILSTFKGDFLGWEVYSDEDIKFVFRYPKDFPPSDSTYSVSVLKNTTTDDYLADLKSNINFGATNEYEIDNFDGRNTSGTSIRFSGIDIGYHILFQRDTILIDFSLHPSEEYEKDLLLLEKILSTFELTG